MAVLCSQQEFVNYHLCLWKFQGTSVCQAVVVSVLIVTLFTSRAVYNFITVSPSIRNKLPGFGYDWVNVSDQV